MDQKREQDGEYRMNDGPFRMPNAADRGSSRPAATPRQPEELTEVKEPVEEVKPVHHRSTSSRRAVKEEAPKKPYIVGGIIAAVVVVLLLTYLLWPKNNSANPPIDSSKYQAVSFSDGQLYFGKLSFVNDQYMKLTDIFYLQPQSEGAADANNPQKATSTSQNFKLVKFTDVIYGPEDEMTIPKSQVLFYENVASGGKIAQLISQYKKSH